MLLSGKKLDHHHKEALKKTSMHIALTVTAAAATSSGIGIAAGVVKGLSLGVLAKSISPVMHKLHIGVEFQHVSHLFGSTEKEDDNDLIKRMRESDDPMVVLTQAIASSVSSALEDTKFSKEDLVKLAEHASDETKAVDLRATANGLVASLLRATLNDDEPDQFWGKAGAGCLFYCPSTGRFLIQQRGAAVKEPLTWGTWGGAVDGDESPVEAMKREVQEETGYHGAYKMKPLNVFRKGDFNFHNFLVLVDEEFKPKLSWETKAYVWTALEDLPAPLHFGMKGLLPYLRTVDQSVTAKAAKAA
jgi:8-oxo-dGTP pyrophosphatase MutT (NUDIX family)